MLAHCPQPEHPCIIYEYMNGGTLGDYLTNNQSISVVDALVIIRDIAEGLVRLFFDPTGLAGPQQPHLLMREVA